MEDNKGEISLQELIKKIKDWFNYLISRWLIIMIGSLIGVVVGITVAYFSKPKYKALLSFVLSADTRSSNGLMGLASQFGLDINSGGSNDVFSGDNITSLMTSRRMVEKALFKKPPSLNTTLLNLYVKEMQLNRDWENNTHLKMSFPFPEDQSKLTAIQDSLIKEIHFSLVENSLSVFKPDKKQSIFQVSTISGNEIFSTYITKYLVEETASFYIATKTKIAKQNLDMLQHEADSLRRSLGSAISSTASIVDQNFNLNAAFQVRKSAVQQGQTNATVIGAAYGEVVKNLEIAKITLQKETPLFQIIDEPSMPLKKDKLGKVKTGAILGFTFGFLVILFLSLRKTYISIIGENHGE